MGVSLTNSSTKKPDFNRNKEVGVNGLSRGERLQIMLTREELRALDDWRFRRRMPSRASAVRELLKRGLAAEGFTIAAEDTKSRDFGMLNAGAGAKADGQETDGHG